MNNYPLVSIVIPVYNMQDYIAETLDSVLASDYPNFEVIIMDDGSKDKSYDIISEYAIKDKRIHCYKQSNGGACSARNKAITKAQGEYILPFDADDKMGKHFVSDAVGAILSDPEIKVVRPSSEYFGERSGNWKLPDYSLRLLARKNMIPICALYRKTDWEKVGGYDEKISVREDWAFWIALLKDGGKVVTLPDISVYYRVRKGSKRISDRLGKRNLVLALNKRHPEFFERELCGPLRLHFSWSKFINCFSRIFHWRSYKVDQSYGPLKYEVKSLPAAFKYGHGTVIYKGRNELRQMNWKGTEVVVKSFRIPNIVNRISYGVFRSSKAQRSFEYAKRLLQDGIGTPYPVGYYTERNGLLFSHSYYASLKSECPYSYIDLMHGDFPGQEEVLRAIARTTAKMHNLGYIHNDYSRGNILFRITDTGVKIEIIDLNRIRFHKIGIHEGCRNFERLPGTKQMLMIMADEYARARGFNPEECVELVLKYNHIYV